MYLCVFPDSLQPGSKLFAGKNQAFFLYKIIVLGANQDVMRRNENIFSG